MTSPDPAPGRVTLVGGGPGDPDLLTLAGLRALQSADIILTDHLAPDVSTLVNGTEVVNVGKTPHGPATPQEEINALLIEHARAGRHVVRLKGGDPFVFGRGGEEFIACADAGVAVAVVPGVTSAVAAPELAGIPVTHRGDPHCHIDWAALAQSGTTLVLLMGVRHLPAIAAALAEGGLPADTPAAVVTKAASPAMQVVRGTLATIADLAVSNSVRPPSVTVIGDVAGLDLR
jgi:uroporphyrin-III C-methyltransferase